QEAAHEEAHIIFGAVIDPQLQDEVRMTVIATGFADKKEAAGVSGKVVDLPRARPSIPAASPAPWRRHVAVPRAEGEAALGDADLEVPAVLRRQGRRPPGPRTLLALIGVSLATPQPRDLLRPLAPLACAPQFPYRCAGLA